MVDTVRLHIAGSHFTDGWNRLVCYATGRTKTLRQYDLADRGDPNTLTVDEVVRTRIISSRISDLERVWFVERATRAPWADVPAGADLRDANPAVEAGDYDRAVALYDAFCIERRRGVHHAKISKVLHFKRPALFPILDSRMVRTYAASARWQAEQHRARDRRRMYWAAIRQDLIDNEAPLATLRGRIRDSDDGTVKLLGELSDLRLLDICTWST